MFCWRKRISKHILSHGFFYFIEQEMIELGKNIEEKMKYLFNKDDFVFNVIKLRIKKVV